MMRLAAPAPYLRLALPAGVGARRDPVGPRPWGGGSRPPKDPPPIRRRRDPARRHRRRRQGTRLGRRLRKRDLRPEAL
eukprot:5494371-Pyramimonas_sp.AAC.1